jgi:hypothetical protein
MSICIHALANPDATFHAQRDRTRCTGRRGGGGEREIVDEEAAEGEGVEEHLEDDAKEDGAEEVALRQVTHGQKALKRAQKLMQINC